MTESNLTFFDNISPKTYSPSISNRSSGSSSRRSTRSTGSISVIIGKTFEATTLPDGSQQIIEATRYKRLSDGYVYTEKKMRSLDDDRSERGSSGGLRINNDDGIMEEDDELRDDDESTAEGMQMQIKQYTSPTKDYDYPQPQGSFLSTFSSSGSFSPANETNSTNHVSVITEDHGGFHNHAGEQGAGADVPRGESFVEEYLYDNDPVGLQQWQEQEKLPLSPPSEGNNNLGWTPAWSDNDDDENSLQLVKQKRTLWSPPSTKRAAEKLRNFFPSTPNNKEKGVDQNPKNGYPLNVNCGNKGNGNSASGEEEEDEERGVGVRKSYLPCNERMRTRRCKVLVFALVLVVIGTIVAAIVLAQQSSQQVIESPAIQIEDTEGDEKISPPPSNPSGGGTTTETTEDSSSPSDTTPDVVVVDTVDNTSSENKQPEEPVVEPPPSCIHLKIVMSSTNDNADVNQWSLARIGPNGDKMITIDSGDSFPELDGNSHSTFKHCVKPGVYTFTITDSGGNGLGPNGKGSGYYITAEDVTLGVSSFFFHEERMTFTLPFDAEDEHTDGDGGDGSDTACTDDFFLAIKTDKNPEQTKWNVVDNNSGDEVLHGGPYSVPWAVYTRRACLPNGNYTFTMLDDGGDGVCCNDGQGFFVLSKDGETIVNSDGEFGMEQSTVFLLGGDDQ